MWSLQQCHVFREGIACGNSFKLIPDAIISLLEHYCLLDIITCAIKREDVNVCSDKARCVLFFYQSGLLTAEFDKRNSIVLSDMRPSHFVISEVMAHAVIDETVVIRAWHRHVDVIIPRYYAFMSHSTNGSTPTSEISEAVFLANIMKFTQYISDDALPFL